MFSDRPFLTYQQQLTRMKLKNISIDDELFAKEVIQSISYYGLINGYKDIFGVYYDEEHSIERFTTTVAFDILHRIFLIDHALNNLLFKYIIYIEKSLKTKLAYKVAQKYGDHMVDYLDFTKYRSNGELDRKSEIQNITYQIQNNKNSASIKHYKENHNTIPPWVATGGIYFGTTINWYKICQENIKQSIADEFFRLLDLKGEQSKELLMSMLTLLQEYRNNIAHGNRTFLSNVSSELSHNLLFSILPPATLTEEEYLSGIGKKDLFAVMISLVSLINDPIIFRQLLYDFGTLFNNDEFDTAITYSPKGNIYQTLNIPDNFLERLGAIYQKKFNI